MALVSPTILRLTGWNHTGDLGPWTFYTKSNGTTVFYDKAPPLEPPTNRQINQRFLFTKAARSWTALTPAQRAAWRLATRLARLAITPVNLWVYFQLTHDIATIRTVEHQSGVSLL